MTLPVILLILVVGCALFPGIQKRIDESIQGLTKSTVSGPASVAFNYYIAGTIVAIGAGAVYLIVQARTAKAAGIEVKGFEVKAPDLPHAPQFGMESGVSAGPITSKVTAH